MKGNGPGTGGSCANCGGVSKRNNLPYGGASIKRYCSIDCHVASGGGSYTKDCEFCGKTFTRMEKRKFCSRECMRGGKNEVRKCKICSTEFTVNLKRVNNENLNNVGVYCSPKCAGKDVKEKLGGFRMTLDYKKLDSLCKIHCTGAEAAAILEMSYDTLNNMLKKENGMTFPEYFEIKSATGKVSLRRRQFLAAMDGNPTMMIWLGKQLLGQEDKKTVDNQSSDGSMTPSLDVSKLSDDVLAQVLKAYDDGKRDGLGG